MPIGSSILRYVEDTAREYGIDRHIRYGHRVRSANWTAEDARWTLEVEQGGETRPFTCNFLFLCAGYYDYAQGHDPAFAGAETFGGRIVHPQFWPEDMDYSGKRVAVIGSGATAVTLVPAMAERAAHVTMVQRSPTYIVSRPGRDAVAERLRSWLPEGAAYAITRWKNVLLQLFFFTLFRKRPQAAKRRLIAMVKDQLGRGRDVETHFTPRYDPWDQRLCLVPDGDLFAAMREGRASVVTGGIERFTPGGIRVKSGEEVPADIIVTATGLRMKLMGGITLRIDGEPVDPSRSYSYKGLMLSDIPNLAVTFGYTNASWTLKADLTAAYVCRLLNAMRRRGLRQCTPRLAQTMEELPFLDFNSGYVLRAKDQLPRRGTRGPWRVNQNYLKDIIAMRFGSVDDQMEFSNPVPEGSADRA
ncbi:cation diffusion facilitator CzcD-associated flavoprotein CzcO [Stakelama pacifica]|uniref:Cation diffusion facilitator CzcD-associated flavoprotein CzcO n=1 Tax=Stakelama pacifica TaxID=517720 RepID=A0A4R6FIH0_9SPHN|nr:cation diffusion facilitator CzcD-associated flavoprotein CzcO [Stakelama pacifica]GGO97900.1 cyclohexanone monooxygenase [Stakelama pacifica]